MNSPNGLVKLFNLSICVVVMKNPPKESIALFAPCNFDYCLKCAIGRRVALSLRLISLNHSLPLGTDI